jgi:hypothetical protein
MLLCLWLGPSLASTSGAYGQGFVIHTFNGSTNPPPFSFPGFGGAIAYLDDVNADGFPDLLVAATGVYVGGVQAAGEAYVFSGDQGTLLYTFSGSTFGEGLGSSLADAGDVDGDGVTDVIVGAVGADPGGLSSAGQAKVFSGATGARLHAFNGTAANAKFGYSVAGAGDVNGDGYADVVVGAPDFPSGFFAQPGQARVFSGADGAVLHTFTGVGNFDHAGYSVAGGRDVDGDSVPDILVGAPIAVFPGAGTAGRVMVYSGASGAIIHDIHGTEHGHLGQSVDFLDDLEGDGTPEIVAGAPEFSSGPLPPQFGVGKAVVFSGANGSVLRTLVGNLAFECLGYAVAGAGDVDGDGYEEVLVGSNFCGTGIINQPGRALVFSGKTGSVLFTFSGTANGQYYGSTVDGGKDVDLDGVPDLFIGAPQVLAVGEAYVISVVGIPSGVTEVGGGCAGSGGFAPRIATFGGPAAVGNLSFGVSVSRGLGGTLAALFASTAVDLAGITVAGCEVYLTGAVIWLAPPVMLSGTPGMPGGGHRLRTIGIPPDPVLMGGTVHFQWAVLDGGAPNGLLVTSKALSVTIQ